MEKQLLLINDSKNSYEKVKAAIIMILGRHPFNAEQITFIAHKKGRAQMKVGDFIDLFLLQEKFEQIGIKTEIEDYEPAFSGHLHQ